MNREKEMRGGWISIASWFFAILNCVQLAFFWGAIEVAKSSANLWYSHMGFHLPPMTIDAISFPQVLLALLFVSGMLGCLAKELLLKDRITSLLANLAIAYIAFLFFEVFVFCILAPFTEAPGPL